MKLHQHPKQRRCSVDGCDRRPRARGLCGAHYDKVLKDENPAYRERQRANTRRWMAKHPEYVKSVRFRTSCKRFQALRAGAARQFLLETLKSQGGGCGLCGRTDVSRWHHDHDHETGRMRSVLCSKCNNGLGFFNDSPDRLVAAARYVTRWKRKNEKSAELDQAKKIERDQMIGRVIQDIDCYDPRQTNTSRPAPGVANLQQEGQVQMTTATATKTKPKAKASKKRNGPSRRAQQRLIALRMGLEKKGMIPADELREACRKAGLDKAGKAWGANFAQDMKKDAVLFNPVEKGGKRVGWRLTGTGKKAAKQAAKA